MSWESNAYDGTNDGALSAADWASLGVGSAIAAPAASSSSPAWYQTAGTWAGEAATGVGAFFRANAGALLNAYTADRNADAAEAAAARNAAAGMGQPQRAPAAAGGGIDKRILIGGALLVAVLGVVYLARR